MIDNIIIDPDMGDNDTAVNDMADTDIADTPTFLGLLDFGPVADALALHVSHLTSEKNTPKLFETSGVALQKCVLRTGDILREPSAALLSLAATCHKAFDWLAPHVYGHVNVWLDHEPKLDHLHPIARQHIRHLTYYVSNDADENQVQKFAAFANSLPRLRQAGVILADLTKIQGLIMPGIEHLKLELEKDPTCGDVLAIFPNLRNLIYTCETGDPDDPGNQLRLSISMPAQGGPFVRNPDMDMPAMDGPTVDDEPIYLFLKRFPGAEWLTICPFQDRPSDFIDILKQLCRLEQPPRNVMFQGFAPHSEYQDLLWTWRPRVPELKEIQRYWPAGIERLIVAGHIGVPGTHNRTARVSRLTRSEDEVGSVTMNTREGVYVWPGEDDWGQPLEWADEAWETIERYDSRPQMGSIAD